MADLPLVIWVNSPPFVERGAFDYLVECWTAPVVYAVISELRSERLAMGWCDNLDESGATIRARGPESVEEFCDQTIREFPDAIHLVGGLASVTGKALARIVRSTPPERVAVFSERPGAYGPRAKRIAGRVAIPIKYRWLVLRYRRRVGLLLPLGVAGVETFVRYGWPRERVAPFMYCPMMHEDEPSPVREEAGPVRFLYVGRLSRFTKGTDVLLRAAERLRGDWSLTLVGGHGDLVDRVQTWAAERENVEMVGRATPAEVGKVMANHDVCVVPSRFDGWNVVVNEALYSARGVIVTDEAVSHEMVCASGAGIVVRARSAQRLAEAMQQVVDEPTLTRTWGDLAARYTSAISPASVGRYLCGLLRAAVMRSFEPCAEGPPWLRDDCAGPQKGGRE